MSVIVQSSLKNRLLRGMNSDDFAQISAQLEPIELKLRDTLVKPSQRLAHIIFPENCIASVVAITPAGRQSEVGIVGCEGMVDVCAINGTDSSPLDCFVQIPGRAHRLPLASLQGLIELSPTFRTILARYAQSFLIQVSHTAMANATCTIDERLARWLLMSQDRVGGSEIVMTHEFLSVMLGVRRAGVTIALQDIERHGQVKARRGSITITDRPGLERLANEAYGGPEAEYQRLFGYDFRVFGTAESALVAA